jgi:hypothetical protein
MIDFPANPTVGQTFQSGNTVYKCVSTAPAVWSATVAAAGIPEAPADGGLYGRKSAAWSIVNKTALGLGNVDNTSDANKPTNAQQDAKYLIKAGDTMTGALNLVTSVANDFTKKAINSEWFFGQVGTAVPQPNGSGSPGTSSLWSRQDHIHPATAAIVPSGTRMLFLQAAAPTGWVQITDDSANNRMIRIVNWGGGGTAGAHDPTVMNVVPAHTHSFNTGYVSVDHSHWTQTGGRSSGHLHGIPDPGHGHGTPNYTQPAAGGNFPTAGGGVGTAAASGTYGAGTGVYADWDDRDHSHSGQSGGISANHYHGGSTDNGSSQTNWSPRFIEAITCYKA